MDEELTALWRACKALVEILSTKVHCSSVRCYKEVEYEKHPSAPVTQYPRQILHEVRSSLVVLRHSFDHFYHVEPLDNWTHGKGIEGGLSQSRLDLFLHCHNKEISAISDSPSVLLRKDTPLVA